MTEARSEVISFRLTESEAAIFKKSLEDSGLSRSDFFRQLFIEKKITFNIKQRKPVDYDKLLYQVNMIGNNINQIAKTVNSLNAKGVLTNGLAKSINDSLLVIVSKLDEALEEI